MYDLSNRQGQNICECASYIEASLTFCCSSLSGSALNPSQIALATTLGQLFCANPRGFTTASDIVLGRAAPPITVRNEASITCLLSVSRVGADYSRSLLYRLKGFPSMDTMIISIHNFILICGTCYISLFNIRYITQVWKCSNPAMSQESTRIFYSWKYYSNIIVCLYIERNDILAAIKLVFFRVKSKCET
jgi:hypothetical protein